MTNATYISAIAVKSPSDDSEVMRRAGSGPASPAPPAPPAASTAPRTSENKELLRQQLLSTSKERADRQEQAKPKHARNRQKNRWKLKFHHQALPQEYLDHYEQSLQKANAKQKKTADKPKPEPNADINNFTNETFKIWAQRLAGIQNETGTLTVPQVTSVLNMAAKPRAEEKKKRNPAIAPSKIVTYEDLPYMGEMTLNNSKPRRGRKPKKADICHLIYENYGTVVPGQPPPQERPGQPSMCPPFRGADAAAGTPKTDLQNKIISSLLERKLSQENRRRLEGQSPPRFRSPDEPMPAAPATAAGPLHSDDEPLNLCIRDLLDLKIQIQKKFGNIYSSPPEVKSEADSSGRESPGSEQPNAISVIQRNTNVAPATASSSPELSSRARTVSPALSEPARSSAGPDGYVFWPHPLALQAQLLCCQRLAEPTEPHSPDGRKLVLKQISELLDPKVIKRVEEAKSPDGANMKRASPNPAQGPLKRKRSAIFIPPVPAKSSSSTPTTEVSICKFKFTGGSKPSLQEKKMLSVDSGGNFRYYSGTGSKGNKSYESAPKDSNVRSEMPTETCTAMKPDERSSPSASKDDLNKKKRKSRKTLQREKLEQTFKEKGFLIQTQQLQSAEGATYCKFRQLRKFTRYLFRSWKDYLPGELDERPSEDNAGEQQAKPGGATEWG
ncbi:unnamed protein product, partial [Iphiclides podalirius]